MGRCSHTTARGPSTTRQGRGHLDRRTLLYRLAARLDGFRPDQPSQGRPTILWKHRWEYDKDPAPLFQAVYALHDEGLDIGLILRGESFRNRPDEFLVARQRPPERIVHFGYAEDAAAYSRLLWQADAGHFRTSTKYGAFPWRRPWRTLTG